MDSVAAIKDARKRLGVTQEQFASMAHVSLATVQRWESGRAVPSHYRTVEELRRLGVRLPEAGPDAAEAVAR
jgi:transcriptional regulator with XRE-family HTH domain